MPSELKQFDDQYRTKGSFFIAGVDEAGRGPLAGPVVIAAVVLPPTFYHPEINDSKLVKEAQRYRLEKLIRKVAIDYQIVVVDHQMIDTYNIRQATLKGMKESLSRLMVKPDVALIDGERLEYKEIKTVQVVHGDRRSLSIASASILAKTFRDQIMLLFHQEYPEYGFDKHKGYGTKDHRQKIKELGPCPIHRKSFLKKISNW